MRSPSRRAEIPADGGPASARPTLVVMAKAARPGAVKTRLTRTGGNGGAVPLSAEQACGVHRALFTCVLERLGRYIAAGRVAGVLAMDDPAGAPAFATGAGWRVVEQGGGDLGDRLGRVWRALGGGPAAFFGVDSPDVPPESLETLLFFLENPDADAALGPVPDGGYWTLVAHRHVSALLSKIDWGTARVYDQTHAAARGAGLRLIDLPGWHDVDDPADLAALRQRLRDSAPADPALATLARELDALCERIPPAPLQGPPMNDPALTTAPPSDGSATDYAGSTILVVDDNEQNVELLQAYLEALPCEVVTAGDGVEAMAYLDDTSHPLPDLLLLDVMMPKMSGFEVCQRIKEDPRTRTVPVMMVTALNELGDIERGVEAGTDDFLTKPVNKLELITRVKSLLRVRHLKRELDRTEAYIRELEQRDED